LLVNALNHKQARYYLHLGHDALNRGEQASLEQHLAMCVTCRTYAADLTALQSRLVHLMHTRWGSYGPGPEVNDKVQTRLRRKMRQKQFLNFAGSVLAAAELIALVVILGWLVWMGKLTRPTPPGPAATPATLEPEPPALDEDHWTALPGLAALGDEVKLLGFTLPAGTLSPGGTVELTLYWQTRVLLSTYSIFVHVLDADNKPVAQVDGPLVNSTCAEISQLSSGMRVTCFPITLPELIPSGQYQLVAGVYDSASGRRLITVEGENTVPLTSIEVQATDNAPPPTPTTAPTPTPLPIPPDCPVTPPNGLTPPGEQPYPTHHGNGILWTGLWPGGVLVPPQNVRPDGWLTFNWWWWRGEPGQLTIQGRRLDTPAPPLRAEIPEGFGDSGYQDSWLIFPSEGCWEVTGKLGDSELTFVTFVVKLDEED
jgi:hypothetical protein